MAKVQDRMPEAEVALRLAIHLLGTPNAPDRASVAIDGAQVKVHGKQVFDVHKFMSTAGWKAGKQQGKNSWQATYAKGKKGIEVHSRSGVGDVVVQFADRTVRAECKGGPLKKKPGSPEHRIVTTVLGQVVAGEADPQDDLVVAVPDTEWFKTLVERIAGRPLVKRTGIRFALVHPTNGAVTWVPSNRFREPEPKNKP